MASSPSPAAVSLRAVIIVAGIGVLLSTSLGEPVDARALLVAALLAAAFRFPVAAIREDGPFSAMVLDGPVVFTALLVMPRSASVLGVALGAAAGHALHVAHFVGRPRLLAVVNQAAVAVLAVSGGSFVLGPDPTTLRPERLVVLGVLAAIGCHALTLLLHLAPPLLAGTFRWRAAPSMIRRSWMLATPVISLALLAALAERTLRGASLLIVVAAAAAVITSRRLAALDRLATMDTLTGCANRRGFDAALDAAHSRHLQIGESYAVVVVDLDRFKDVNDEFGHDAGDAVLIEIAGRLMGAIRSGDVVARVGGDEFGVVMASAGSEEASLLTDRLLARCRAPIALSGDVVVSVSASIGAAAADGQAGPHEVVRRADSAAYASKRAGRDRLAGAHDDR